MKAGVVGSGIAGLVAARELHRQGIEVTLIDSLPALGMSGHGVAFEREGKRWLADVPSRMFNPRQWPSLWALYRELEVELEPVEPTQAFHVTDRAPYLRLAVAYRPQQLLGSLLNRRSRHLVGEAARLIQQGIRDLDAGLDSAETFERYLERNQFSPLFRHGFLYPTLSSTVCTCSYEAVAGYPAIILLEALRGLVDTQQRPSEEPRLWRVRAGTAEVARRLAAGIRDLRLKTRVESIRQFGDLVEVMIHHDGVRERLSFDHLVLATQANTAVGLLSEDHYRERDWLSRFRYEQVSVVVHSDTRWMPARRQDWATFNQRLNRDPGDDARDHAATCTVWLNRFHRDWDLETPVFQSIHPAGRIDPGQQLAQIELERPLVTPASFELWNQCQAFHAEPERRIWFTGSYAVAGVPLLESGARSAQQVVERLIAAPV